MTAIQKNNKSNYSPSRNGRNNSKDNRTVGRNFQSLLVMLIVTLLLGAGIIPRLFYLQVVQGDRHKQLADNNRIRLIPKAPIRGNIFDRNGKILASSRLSHAVYLWPVALKKAQWTETRKRISQILNIPEAEIQKRLEAEGYSSPSLLRIARGISPTQITALAEYGTQMEGVEVDVEAVRNYPNGDLAAHILGYTGEISEEELAKLKPQGYRMGDIIGQMGVESSFESLLRGEWGGQQVEVDGANQVLQILGQKQAKPGNNIQLTIDIDLQKEAEKILGDRQGAIIALDPRNGEVLAMVSRPTFDPNIFSSRISEATWQQLQSKGNPFVNRTLRGFPPASTFKIVTAAAGMETGKFSPDTVLPTYAALSLGGGAELGESNKAGYGMLDFVGAMAYSSNTFFGQVAKGVGGPDLISWTRKFGFGKKTGIELADEESPGLVADNAWKMQNQNWEWTEGDTVNMSIGQGFTQATPLQVAVMFAVPANGGYRIKPHLLKDNEIPKNWRESMNMKPETIDVLQKGLRAVVTMGTGQVLNDAPLAISGKSGTAEAPPGESHTWFGAYGPAENPEIVVVAFAEHSGGGGGSVMGPLVAQLFKTYHQLKLQRSGVTIPAPFPSPTP